MKAIILAAGQGKRLRPLTNDKPKCLVELAGESLLDRQLFTLKSCGLNEIIIVGGWYAEQLRNKATRFYINPEFDNSNMVETLFCAGQEFDSSDDILICYSDIIYETKVISSLLNENAIIATTIDTGWRHLWQLRMENPLDDAETLKLDDKGFIKELGKRAQNYDDIEGQYMGLIRVSAPAQKKFRAAYTALPEKTPNNNLRKDMYMTEFLQYIIDFHMPIKAVCTEGGWLEVDTLEDILRYEAALQDGTLDKIVILNA